MPAAARPPMVKMMNSCTAAPYRVVSRLPGQHYAKCGYPRGWPDPCSQGVQFLLLLRRQMHHVLGVAVPDGLRGLRDRLVVDDSFRFEPQNGETRGGLGVLVGE